jgi:hypothetical protein
MAYWACAQLEAHRQRLALHTLDLAGYTTYLPRVRIQRSAVAGRKATERFRLHRMDAAPAWPACVKDLPAIINPPGWAARRVPSQGREL